MTMSHRRTPHALGAAVLLLASPGASAASDLYANVGPGGSVSGLTDHYPLGNYALDQHFSAVKASITGGLDASGVPAMIAFFLANLIWQITAFISNALITLFSFAFSLDLLNGSEATGGAGALAPVSDALRGLYAHTFGEPWMVIAITLAGCWAMWRALIQRRYTETTGALAMSLAFCLLALAIVARPDATIGQASRWSNELSAAFLSVSVHGDLAGGDQARRAAADQLFALLIYKPWVALNFGGTEHCIRSGTGSQDHDPISVPVRPLSQNATEDARARRQLQTAGQVTVAGKTCINNTARYPQHFLRYPPGTEDRDAVYDALNDADPTQLPDSDPSKAAGSYQPAIADKPATDAMEKGGQTQRLLLALVVVAGELGAVLLLGSLSVSVVVSQVVVLLLACFSPVALVCAIVPGRGHDAFRTWASHLATYLVRKAAYSLVLAVTLAVLSAMQDATSNLGWLMSFGLQALLLWSVFLQRHKLTGHLTSTMTGQRPEPEAQLRRLLGLRHTTRTITPARRPQRTQPPASRSATIEPPAHAAPAPTPPPALAAEDAPIPSRRAPESVGQDASEAVSPRESQSRRSDRSPAQRSDAPATARDGHRQSRLARGQDTNPSDRDARVRRPPAAVRPHPARTDKPTPTRPGDDPAAHTSTEPPRQPGNTGSAQVPHSQAPGPRREPGPRASLADELVNDRQRVTQELPEAARRTAPPRDVRDDANQGRA